MSNFQATINGTVVTNASEIKAAGFKGPVKASWDGTVPGSGRMTVTLGKLEKEWLGAWVRYNGTLVGQVWSLGSDRNTVHIVRTELGRNVVDRHVHVAGLEMVATAGQFEQLELIAA